MTTGHLPPRERVGFVAALLVGCALAGASQAASASVSYTYDDVGRIATAAYDDGTCVAYAYDPSGNRTAQTNSTSSGSETPTWGAGAWGCFGWSASSGASREASVQTPASEPTLAGEAPQASAVLAEREPNVRSGA
jgi:YD repeat-containing protein